MSSVLKVLWDKSFEKFFHESKKDFFDFKFVSKEIAKMHDVKLQESLCNTKWLKNYE